MLNLEFFLSLITVAFQSHLPTFECFFHLPNPKQTLKTLLLPGLTTHQDSLYVGCYCGEFHDIWHFYKQFWYPIVQNLRLEMNHTSTLSYLHALSRYLFCPSKSKMVAKTTSGSTFYQILTFNPVSQQKVLQTSIHRHQDTSLLSRPIISWHHSMKSVSPNITL